MSIYAARCEHSELTSHLFLECLYLPKLIACVLFRIATQRAWSRVGLLWTRKLNLTSPALPDPVRYVACTLEPVGNVAPCTPSPKLTVVLPPIVFVMNWREVELDSAKLFTCCQRRPFTLIVTIGCIGPLKRKVTSSAPACYLPLTSIRQNGTKWRGRNDGGSGSAGSDNKGNPAGATLPPSTGLALTPSQPFSTITPVDSFHRDLRATYSRVFGRGATTSG
jgi:hypothetical protein